MNRRSGPLESVRTARSVLGVSTGIYKQAASAELRRGGCAVENSAVVETVRAAYGTHEAI
jgi:hypothetical protein